MTALRATQLDAVRGLLADGLWHSTLEFIDLGVLRPSARVYELRRAGAAIETRRVGRVDRGAVFEYRQLPVHLREGHSLRAIGGTLGVSEAQVHRDLSTVTDVTVPERVIGLDGKSLSGSEYSEPDRVPARRKTVRNLAALEVAELLAVALRDVDGLVVDEPRPDGLFFATLRLRGGGGGGFSVVVEQLTAREAA